MAYIARIKEALYYGKVISGDYRYIVTKEGDALCQREMYLRIIRGGKEINVHINSDDYILIDTADLKEDDENQIAEIEANIHNRFETMDKLTEMIISGDIKSLMISGAAGIGKSYGLEKRLNEAIDNEEIDSFSVVKGKISAIALFAQLYEHRNPGDVLVLDDSDVIFQDEVSLNLLKSALDTGETRTCSWLTATSWLQENNIEQQFDFEGTCVFVTNLDFDRMIEKGTNLAPHFKALISRSIYLDLGIHTNREILIRVKQVVENTNMLDVHGIDKTQKRDILEWLEENYSNLRELSLRTVLKLASFITGDPENWRKLAEATMIKNRNFLND